MPPSETARNSSNRPHNGGGHTDYVPGNIIYASNTRSVKAVIAQLGIHVALPEYPAFALLDIARPPRGVEVMKGDKFTLYVGPEADELRGIPVVKAD